MPSIALSKSTTAVIAKVPYLNSVPFFRGWLLGERYELADCVPRRLGERAAAGEVLAGLLPVADYFRLQDAFEPLGHVGIAVRGEARSALLFSRKPIRQLNGATIAVTEETSTTACLLRLLLEQRYGVTPAAYPRGRHHDAEALLLIGDEALRAHYTTTQYPFEIDLGFEWWLWQHLPFVFAIWAIRKDASAHDKKRIEAAVMRALAVNTSQLETIAQEYAHTLQMPAEDVRAYLSGFVYRFGPSEAEGIAKFKALVDEFHVL